MKDSVDQIIFSMKTINLYEGATLMIGQLFSVVKVVSRISTDWTT